MTRAELRTLADDRLADTQALLAAQRWSGAYYLAGYAIECGLKACVLQRISTTPEVIFRDRKFSLECWTHNLLELLKRADLEGALDQAVQQNQPLGQNWLAVKDWSEASRYQQWTPAQAQNLVDAVGHANDGVLTWVRNHW